MKLTINLLLTVILILSCGKESKNSDADEAQAPTVEVEPLPANSPGVTVLEDPITDSLRVRIPARKSYNPTVWTDGLFFVPGTVSLLLPETLPVTEGRSGNHLAYIDLAVDQGTSFRCIYLGRGSNTAAEFNSPPTPYEFDFCVDLATPVTPGTRASLKLSSLNILDASERITTPISLERGDQIRVSVNHSNRNGTQNVTGAVLATLILKR